MQFMYFYGAPPLIHFSPFVACVHVVNESDGSKFQICKLEFLRMDRNRKNWMLNYLSFHTIITVGEKDSLSRNKMHVLCGTVQLL